MPSFVALCCLVVGEKFVVGGWWPLYDKLCWVGQAVRVLVCFPRAPMEAPTQFGPLGMWLVVLALFTVMTRHVYIVPSESIHTSVLRLC